MADNSGSGFMGLIAGLLIAAILIVGGIFLFGGGLAQHHTASIDVNVPEAAAPNGG
jgi:hypothetical protein